MNEIVCKNCGKQIMKLHVSGNYWVHVGELLRECYPDTVAEPSKKCKAEIIVNEIKYECELEHNHEEKHYCEVFDDYIVKW